MRSIRSTGPDNARIMFVGEAPGAEEERDGVPFVGSAGKLLRKFMLSAGIDPDEAYLTNICPVRPPSNKIRAFFDNQGMPNDLVMDGMLELQAAIKRIKPNLVVALGNYPLWALTQVPEWKFVKDKYGNGEWTYTGIFDWRGSILESTLVPGTKVIGTFHPSYINREGYSDHGTFAADMSRIKREMAFPEIRRPQKELFLNPQGSDRLWLRDRLLSDENKLLTVDIEYVPGKMFCIGMTNDRDYAVTIGIQNASDMQYCRDVLLSGIGINAQNAMFDCSVLAWEYGIDLFPVLKYDTMLASHASNIELPKGLDYLVSIYTDQPYYKNMVNWKKIKQGGGFEQLYDYNSKDVWTQHEIMEEQIKWEFNDPGDIEGSKIAWRTFQFEMALVGPLWEISKRGIKIDEEKMVALQQTLRREAEGFSAILSEEAGFAVNVKSVVHIRKILYDQLGLPIIRATKTGAATDDKTIASLQVKATDPRAKEVVSLIRDIRRRRDLLSKFADVERDTDGRSRGMYNPAGTGTGRLASKKFYPTGLGHQQQNIPRDKRARSLFVADRGKLFGNADLERAESLVVAYLTQDPEMLRVHGPGMDAHKELAAVLYGVTIDEVTGDQRYMGKQTRHAANYMEGWMTFMTNVNKLAEQTGVSIDAKQAKHYLATYKTLHPFLQHWWDEVKGQVATTRCLYNLVGPNGRGRRRIFYDRIDSSLPVAVAYTPQSTVGDVLNVGLLNIEGKSCHYTEYLEMVDQYKEWSDELMSYGYQSLLQVHDSVGFQFDETAPVDRVVWLIRQLLTVPLTVPKTLETFTIPVEVKIGPSWGEGKVYV